MSVSNVATKTSFYKPELDVLRFFAFLGVFLFHALQFSPASLAEAHVPPAVAGLLVAVTRAGMYGVDLFFVLSSYLITELLLREKAQFGRLNVKAFYIRRALRIWPLYYAFLLLAAFLPALNPTHEFSLPYVAAFAAFVGNWAFFFWGWVGYAAVPLWTLSIEEQFYLVWPPIVERLSPRGILWMAAALIAIANGSRMTALALHQGTHHLWTSTLAHLDSLAAGIILAVLLHGRRVTLTPAARLLLLAGGVAVLLLRGHSVSIESQALLYPLQTLVGFPAVVLACTALLVACIDARFRSSTLEYLGRVSYGLYVCHMACILLITHIMGTGNGLAQSVGRLGLTLGVTIGVAIVSYEVLEKPFLRLKLRFTRVPSRPINGRVDAEADPGGQSTLNDSSSPV